jgi:hypothetical protein
MESTVSSREPNPSSRKLYIDHEGLDSETDSKSEDIESEEERMKRKKKGNLKLLLIPGKIVVFRQVDC